MSAPDSSQLESPDALESTRRIVANALKIFAGLLVGAIVGLVIAGFADRLPPFRIGC